MPQCSPEDYSRSLMKPPSVTCLSTGDSIGLTITGEAGLLSLLAIIFVVVVIAHNVRKRYHLNASLRIFHHPMDLLMASLLLADTLQAIAVVLNLKWVHDGKVETGDFCNVQGILLIFGGTGVALSTLAIGFFTFLGIWAHAEASMKFTYFLVATLWSFIGVLVAVSVTVNRSKEVSFIGPVPYWCWVNVGLGWKMLDEYIWLWLALAISFLIYIPLYLWMRGNLLLPPADEAAWWRFRFAASRDLNPQARARRRQALVMLAYPVIYCLLVIPLSAIRWTAFVQTASPVPPAATFASLSIFGLSGFSNVVLLMKTRPSTGLFDHLIYLKSAQSSVHEAEPADKAFGRLPPEGPLEGSGNTM